MVVVPPRGDGVAVPVPGQPVVAGRGFRTIPGDPQGPRLGARRRRPRQLAQGELSWAFMTATDASPNVATASASMARATTNATIRTGTVARF